MLAESTSKLGKSLTRLSSGSRIVAPQDDAAGLSQSLKFDAQINRNDAARSNVANAISWAQTQDGFLQTIQAALDRMSELALLVQDVTKTGTDLGNYSEEYEHLRKTVSNSGQTAKFNGTTIFNRSLEVTIDSEGGKFTMNSIDTADIIALSSPSNYIGYIEDYGNAMGKLMLDNFLKPAIQLLADFRAKVGANIQRLQLTDEQLSIHNENLRAATSRIKDLDVAEESTQYARHNILTQSGTAMLAQANVLPQAALRLIS